MHPNVLLILDAASVASSSGVTFHLNAATRHPENPVMSPGEPHEWDSLCVSWPGTVLYSPRDHKFRCWYTGMDVVQTPDRTWHTGYAESDDGIHWHKPDCRQAEFLSKPTNQLKPDWNASVLSLVFENPDTHAPDSHRFGSLWIESRFSGDEGDWTKSLFGKSLAWSSDGITWTRDRVAYGELPRAPFLDISQLLFDSEDPDPSFRWKAYGQLFRPRPDRSGWPGIRNIAMAHGADVSHLEEPPPDDFDRRIILAPQSGIDEELHFAAVQKIGSTYLMLFESDRFSKNPIRGDLRLAVSDDGKTFRRVHPQSPLLATGAKGMWDENLLVTTTAGWQEVGDEHWIFYFGCPSLYNSWPAQYCVSPERRGCMFAPVYLGLATLPRDRFGYAQGAGSVTTHPIEIDDGVWLNADGDGLQITAIDASGKPIAHGALGDERRQRVYRQIEWRGEAPPRGSVAIEISLPTGARLYSVASGRGKA